MKTENVNENNLETTTGNEEGWVVIAWRGEQKFTIVFHRFHDRRRVHCVNYNIEEKKRKNKKKTGIIKTTQRRSTQVAQIFGLAELVRKERENTSFWGAIVIPHTHMETNTNIV